MTDVKKPTTPKKRVRSKAVVTVPEQPTAIEDTPITVLDPQIIPYKYMYACAVGSAVIYGAVIAVETVARANPELGVSLQILAWLEVVQNFLGGIGFLLPTLRKSPSSARKGMD